MKLLIVETTVTKLEILDSKIISSPISAKKIQLTRRIIGEYVDWGKILDGYVNRKRELVGSGE